MKCPTRIVASLFLVLGFVASNRAVASDGAVPVVEVKVLEAGKGEKHLLRYTFAKGAQAEMAVTSKMTAKTSMAGREMPGANIPVLTTRMETAIADVNAAGDAQVDIVFTGPRGGAMKGKAVVNNRGIVQSLTFDLPANAPAGTQQQAQSTQQNTSQYFVPLPEEPVGEGAKWQASQSMILDGMNVQQVTKYTLVSHDGDSLNLEVEMAQGAADQEFERPKTPGMKVHLKSHIASAKGTATLDLKSLLIAASKMEMSMETTLTMPQIGELTQSMDASMTGTTVRRPPGGSSVAPTSQPVKGTAPGR